MRILCIIAHPDDESFSAGGTLAQHTRLGDSVHVCSLADGVGSRFRRTGPLDAVECAAIHDRRAAFYAATHVLGAVGHWAMVFPDQQADQVSLLVITDHIDQCLEDYPADLVYTHHVGDVNLDHRRVAEAVLVCTRGQLPVRAMTPEWPNRCVGPRFAPVRFLTLSDDDLDTKVRACRCYADELREYPHPRSLGSIQGIHTEAFMEIAD